MEHAGHICIAFINHRNGTIKCPFEPFAEYEPTFSFTILWSAMLHIIFVFFPSLSLWLLFTKTGTVAIHQVQTVTGAAKKAWRGTGKLIHLFIHSFIYSFIHSIS